MKFKQTRDPYRLIWRTTSCYQNISWEISSLHIARSRWSPTGVTTSQPRTKRRSSSFCLKPAMDRPTEMDRTRPRQTGLSRISSACFTTTSIGILFDRLTHFLGSLSHPTRYGVYFTRLWRTGTVRVKHKEEVRSAVNPRVAVVRARHHPQCGDHTAYKKPQRSRKLPRAVFVGRVRGFNPCAKWLTPHVSRKHSIRGVD